MSTHDEHPEARRAAEKVIGPCPTLVHEHWHGERNFVAQRHAEKLDEATAIISEAMEERERELAELGASFELRHDADMRAIQMWQKETGRTEVWPDHADLCVWLLARVEKLAASDREHRIKHQQMQEGAERLSAQVQELVEAAWECHSFLAWMGYDARNRNDEKLKALLQRAEAALQPWEGKNG